MIEGIEVLGLGPGLELPLLLLLIIVILFGAKKIPELARNLGRARAEYDRGRKQVEKEIREEFARPQHQEADIDKRSG